MWRDVESSALRQYAGRRLTRVALNWHWFTAQQANLGQQEAMLWRCHETHYIIFTIIVIVISNILVGLTASSLHIWCSTWPLFDRFVVAVMVPCLERIGWSKVTGESHLKSMLRGLLICQLGTRGCGMVEQRCQQLFNNWLGDGGIECEVKPGLREVVMKVAMSSCPQHQSFSQAFGCSSGA